MSNYYNLMFNNKRTPIPIPMIDTQNLSYIIFIIHIHLLEGLTIVSRIVICYMLSFSKKVYKLMVVVTT